MRFKVPGSIPRRIDWHAERERIDLADVAARLLGPAPGRRGERSSRKLWWSCPFHEDNNPSFCIPIGSPWWRCYGCDAKGDAATLVMKLNGTTFPEAVAYLTGGPSRSPRPNPRGCPRRTPWPSWEPPLPGCGLPRGRTPWPT
jgi:hypothetical protein